MAASLVRSLIENLPPHRTVSLRVVDGGIAPTTKERLLDSWKDERLHVDWVEPSYGGESELPVWGRLPPLTYARIFVPHYVPESRRAILLDSDLLVRTDLGRLWDEPLDGHVLAVQDPAVPYVSSHDGLASYRELGLPPETPYFNAGVMLIDVERWRRDRISEQVMAYIIEHGSQLRYCDQDGINAVLHDKWRPLDPRWQVQPRLLRCPGLMPHLAPETRTELDQDPWIYHFSGRLKPWVYRGKSRADELFFETLDRTAWKGWRPRRSLRSVFYRLYDSPLRRWLYPLELRGHGLWRKLTRSSATTQR